MQASEIIQKNRALSGGCSGELVPVNEEVRVVFAVGFSLFESTSPGAMILMSVFWLGTTLILGILARLLGVGNFTTGALVASILSIGVYRVLPWDDVRSIVTQPVLVIANGTSGQLEGRAQRADTNWSFEGDPRLHLSSSSANVVATTAIGQVKGVRPGWANVTAEFEGARCQTLVKVTDARLVNMVVFPSSLEYFQGHGVQFRVTGLFSDGRTQDLTSGAQWSSSNPKVARVLAGGKLSLVGRGRCALRAHYRDKVAICSVR